MAPSVRVATATAAGKKARRPVRAEGWRRERHAPALQFNGARDHLLVCCVREARELDETARGRRPPRSVPPPGRRPGQS